MVKPMVLTCMSSEGSDQPGSQPRLISLCTLTFKEGSQCRPTVCVCGHVREATPICLRPGVQLGYLEHIARLTSTI